MNDDNTLLTGQREPDGTYIKYLIDKDIYSTKKGWWYCTNGNSAFLVINNKQIPLTDPKQQRGRGYALWLCALLCASSENEVTQREFEDTLTARGIDDWSGRTLKDTAHFLNKKVRKAFDSNIEWLIQTDTGWRVNDKFIGR